MKFETKVIHGGQEIETTYGALMPAIYNSTTFAQKSPGEPYGAFDYTRGGNPTRLALENKLASIENAKAAFSFSSGLAAIDAILKTLEPGDEVLSVNDLYGGSYRMFTKIFQPLGVQFRFSSFQNIDRLEEELSPKTKLIWLESPTNPLMQFFDIAAICKKVKGQNILVAVDNTFASPALQNPLDLGADLVMHSATKYLGGHSDVLAGALMCNEPDLIEKLRFQQFAGGAVLGPQDCYLLLRGIKTLVLRMERHSQNAMIVARHLNDHSKIEKVYYPGLESNPFHELAKKQMRDFGGMLSFQFKSAKAEDASTFLKRLKLFYLAESLGGVESLANLPAKMTHASIPSEKRKEIGIRDDLVRLSVGIEHVQDLIEDIEQALDF